MPRSRAPWIGALVGILGALGGASPAYAVSNGKLAFEVPPDAAPALAAVNPDGSGRAPVPGVPAGSANPAWSPDGTRLAFSSTVSGRAEIYVINADGTDLRRLTDDPVGAIDPTWSPDAGQIAYSGWGTGSSTIFVVAATGGTTRRLTFDSAGDQQPRWSPDGSLIAFASSRSGGLQIWTMAPDGSGQRQLTTQAGMDADPAWSPDAAQIAYTNTDASGLPARSLAVIGRGGGAPRRLFAGDGTAQFPAWSPDGRQIAFSQDGNLYRIPAADGPTSAPVLITDRAVDAVWSVLPPPVGGQISGTVTVSKPGAATTPIAGSPVLSTGTTVNANAGTGLVVFKAQATPPSAAPSTARVQGGQFTVIRRTVRLLWLRVHPPACAAVAAARRPRRSSRRVTARVKRGHFGFIAGHTPLDSEGTNYAFVYDCSGLHLTVSEGVVVVTLRHGRHRRVRVSAGHSLFVANP
jgi:hypothetical protein